MAAGLLLLAGIAVGCTAPEPAPAPASEPAPASAAPRGVARADLEAGKIALAVLERMGGRESWEATRYLRWRFFGGRLHFWDRHTGDVRIESPAREAREGQPARPELLVLMNVDTEHGRVWEDGVEVTDPDKLAGYLDLGRQWWVNDSYWMFMPYKLMDPGVQLRYAGERALEDGRAADVLELTFDPGVGYTPENRYEVFVARDSGLVEQWSFYAEASDAEPGFTLPWAGWRQFGGIWLATNHGRDMDWEIAVFDELPQSLFRDPAPVEL